MDLSHGKPRACPKEVIDLMVAFAALPEVQGEFDPDEPNGPVVTSDSFEVVGWSSDRGILVYTPFCDERFPHDPDADDWFGPEEHFIITEEDLMRMVTEAGFMPGLDRPF